MKSSSPPAEAMFQSALQLHRAGRLSEAEAQYRKVLETHPGHARAPGMLSAILYGRGDHAEIVAMLAPRLEGRATIDGLNLLGLSLNALGRTEEAMAVYRKGIKADPGDIQLKTNLAVTLISTGNPEEAAKILREIVAKGSTDPKVYFNLGLAYGQQGKFDEAMAAYQKAATVGEPLPEAHVNHGNILRTLGRADEALEQFKTAVRLRPAFPEALCNVGASLVDLGRDDEGLQAFRDALQARPDYSEALTNLGFTLHTLGRSDESVGPVLAAVQAEPTSVRAHCNAAAVLLSRGEFAEGWPHYEWRWLVPGIPVPPRDFGKPQWLGEDIAGKTILIHHEQGLGDSIQFVRYVPELQARGARVILEMPRPLHGLFRHFKDVTLVTQGEPLPEFDVQCAVLSLPLAFRTTIQTVPANVPYLGAQPERVAAWRQRLPGSGFRIGVVWQGKPNVAIDQGRSVPLKEFLPLLDIPGVTLISLQKNHGLDQLQALPEGKRPLTLGDDFDSGPDAFLDTAAVMMNLDLIITSDTSVAHLAGALGRPVWVALKFVPDWRYLLRGEDSPWYPTMRLFRQTRRGEWSGVFARMAEELRAVVGGAVERLAPTERIWAKPPEQSRTIPLVDADCRHGRFRFLGTDLFIGRCLAEYGEWSDAEVELCANCLRPGDTVVEVGSNVGSHTVALARVVGPGGTVHAFEPQPFVRTLLAHNLSTNGFTDGTHVHDQVVGAEPGSTKVPPVDYSVVGNFGRVTLGGEIGDDVPVITVDSLGLDSLRLLKVAAEGAELGVLRGATETIRRCRPILYLGHSWHEGPSETRDMIRGLGYEIWWHFPQLYNPGNFRGNPTNHFPRVVSSNILCVPKEMDVIVVGLKKDSPGAPPSPNVAA